MVDDDGARPEIPLALLLLRASRWFDRRVIDGLEELGHPRLTAAQTLAFAHLDPEGTPPAELARRLGTTRQSTADLVAGLTRLGLLASEPDPGRTRGRLVVLTADGRSLAGDARELLAAEEERLPAARVRRLREALVALDLA